MTFQVDDALLWVWIFLSLRTAASIVAEDKAVKDFFKPELRNRLDLTVKFQKLEPIAIKKIVALGTTAAFIGATVLGAASAATSILIPSNLA